MEKLKAKLADVPVLGALLRIQERFGEIQGTALANGIALQGFLSLIPLILVAIAVTGFLAQGDAEFATDVVEAFGLPQDGDTAGSLAEAIDNAQESRRAASVIGVLGLLWSGLAIIAAVQRATDRAWQTKAEGLKDKVGAVLWLMGAAVILLASFALTTVLNFLPAFLAPVSILLGLAVNVGLFLWTFTQLGRAQVGWKAVLPGAVVCAVGFEILKLVGSLLVPRLVANSTALYGSLGIVIALLAWLAFFGRLLVYGAVVNVIRYEDEHGTLTVPVQVPRIDGAIALEADRAGAVTDHL
ncbi:MAG: YihY/virulence factor BrkB family protein [Acidimicrobiales bacterium]